MARRNAPAGSGESPRDNRPVRKPQELPVVQKKTWPFAEGSQNHLDEASAPWPRPSGKSAGALLKYPPQ